MSLEIYLLGQFKLKSNDLPVELQSRPAQSLLAYLALNAGVTHRREKLAGLLWNEAPESNARSYLRLALWRIRKALESASLISEDYLQTNDISVTFNNQSDYWLDAEVILEPAEKRSVEEIIAAVSLYRAELLPGFYDEWIGLERDRLQAAYFQKMDFLLDRLIQARQWNEVLKWSEHWIQHGFSPEPAYRAIMIAHAGLGNPGMISATYRRCAESLNRELNLEPSPETIRLYDQIRRGEWEGLAPPSAHIEHIEYQRPSFFDRGKPRLIEKPLFVAREQELEQLGKNLDKALAERGRVIFITGEAGSGKTALINEFTRRTQDAYAELIVAFGNCNAHTGIGDPYLPFREIMELLTGNIEALWTAGVISEDYAQFLWNMLPLTSQALMDAGPDLIDTFVPGAALLERSSAYALDGADWLNRLDKSIKRKMTAPVTQSPQQGDLFRQYIKVLQLLARRFPIILVVDDLQWADLGSISLLFHLSRNLSGHRILILGVYRPEELALGRAGERHPLEPVVHELQREFGDTSVNVDQANSRAFLEALLDSEPNQFDLTFREMLHLQTRGQPLFTIELLRGMQEQGDLIQDQNGQWKVGSMLDWEKLPVRMEAIIAERIGRLDPSSQAALQVASVEGESFTAEVVAKVQGTDERKMLGRLSGELDKKHRLIRAHSIQRIGDQLLSSYRFRHIAVQKFLYNSLDDVEKVYLHEQVGNALEGFYINQEGMINVAPQLAWHFQEARVIEKAIHYLQKAGDRAFQMSAYHEALDHLNKGLELFASLPESRKEPQQEISLLLSIGTARHFWGGPVPEMEKVYIRARELCQQTEKKDQLSQVLCGLSIYHYVRGEYQIGYEFAEKALNLGLQVNDPSLITQGHWSLGFISFALGNYSMALSHLEETISLYATPEHHHLFVAVRGVDLGLSALAYVACSLWCLGYPEQAEKRRIEALTLARELAHPFTLSDVLCYAGCHLDKMRRDVLALKEDAEEMLLISDKTELPGWFSTGKTYKGEALILLGQIQEGLSLIREGLELNQSMNALCYQPGTLLAMAEAYRMMGKPKEGLTFLEEALELVSKTDERHWEAELYRMQANLQLMLGNENEAEASLEKALEVARRQSAKSWELRSAIDLAQLKQKQGKLDEARQVVGEVYAWFSEGFDTPELKLAKALCATEATNSTILN